MALLIKRIARSNTLPQNQRISGHIFEAALALYLAGHITSTQIKNALNLTSQEENELEWFYDEFNSRNVTGRLTYFQEILACVTALQQEYITEAQFREFLVLPTYTDTTTTTSSTTSTTSTTTTTVPPT